MMTPVQIIALITAVAILVKIIVVSVSRGSWIKIIDKLYARPICALVYFALAALVLYYLLQEISIIQIFAVLAFIALIGGAGIMIYAPNEIKAMAKKVLKKKISGGIFIFLILWVVLAVWAIYEVLLVSGLI